MSTNLLNYVKYAREVAGQEGDCERRYACRNRADELEQAIKNFTVSWSLDHMQVVVGAFTRCVHAVDRIVPGGGGDPVGGRLKMLMQQAA